MVTATNFTASFVSRKGELFTVNGYVADVPGTACKFSQSQKAAAADLPYFRLPSDAYLVGMSVICLLYTSPSPRDS